jgi:outer membrane protein assembly factor BamD
MPSTVLSCGRPAFLARLAVLILAGALSACTASLTDMLPSIFSESGEKEEITDEFADWSEEQFFEEAKAALREERWSKAVQLYEKLEARYPFGPHATQAQIDIAYAYYKNNEPDSALAAVDRFIKLNPAHPNVDYAYYLRGLINYNRGISFVDRFVPTDSSQRDPGSAREAYRQFQELVAKFPNSRYAEDSRQRITALRNNLGMYELHVADFYMRRGAYLAAARRSIEVIRNYQRTPAVPEALKILEEAYRKLELTELADDVARVYDMNYANGLPAEAENIVDPTIAERIWDVIGFE